MKGRGFPTSSCSSNGIFDKNCSCIRVRAAFTCTEAGYCGRKTDSCNDNFFPVNVITSLDVIDSSSLWNFLHNECFIGIQRRHTPFYRHPERRVGLCDGAKDLQPDYTSIKARAPSDPSLTHVPSHMPALDDGLQRDAGFNSYHGKLPRTPKINGNRNVTTIVHNT